MNLAKSYLIVGELVAVLHPIRSKTNCFVGTLGTQAWGMFIALCLSKE